MDQGWGQGRGKLCQTTLLLGSSNAFNKQEKERTPDAELRRLTKTKEVRIIEEEPKQREIERLREVIRVMEEANKASEKERERKREEKEEMHRIVLTWT